MDEVGKRLIEIQTIDSEIVTVEGQLAAYPKRLGALKDEADQLAARLESSKKKLRDARAARAVMETEIAAKRAEQQKYQKHQMQVKNEKEFNAITHQIQALGEAISDEETTALESLEKEEKLEKKIAELEGDLGNARRNLETETARIAPLVEEKRRRLEGLRAERASHMAKLPEAKADQYERLFARFPGNAVASTDGQTCGGCHMSLLAVTVQQLHESGTLAPCTHCRRLLWIKQ